MRHLDNETHFAVHVAVRVEVQGMWNRYLEGLGPWLLRHLEQAHLKGNNVRRGDQLRLLVSLLLIGVG